MRTVHRALSTAVAVGALFPFGLAVAPAAHADALAVPVENAAWFWSAQVSGNTAAGVPYPGGVPQSASGVEAGQLAVAYAGKTEDRPDGTKESVPDKETYLQWDVYAGVPEGATVNSFTFTMFVDPEGHNVYLPQQVAPPGQTPRGGIPQVVACIPLSGFGPAEGDAFAAKPKDDCTDQVYGVYDAAKQSYTFDATVYAQDWVDGKDNFGLAIRPKDDEVDPYQLVFKGPQAVLATLDFTPPEPEFEEPEIPVDPGYVEPPVVDGGSSGYVPAPPAPAPQAQPKPQAPKVAPTRRPATNVAARPVSVDAGIGAEFWLAMLAGVTLLGIVSLVMGDPLVPAALRREDALTKALRRRQAAGLAPGARGLPAHVRTRTL